MALSKTRTPKVLVRAASPNAIESRLRVVADRMRRRRNWLNYRHPYNGNIVRRLTHDIDGPRLGEYIACSAPIHLSDGWNYLSRAFDAACRGDRSSAYHLAYYGELRAAISLLATEGVGIFNRHHIALDDALEPTEYVNTTHKATWNALSAWAREPGRAARLLESITVESKTLSQWLVEIGVGEPARALVAAKWLSAWSIDLKTMSADPRRRNEMSYRPSRIRPQRPEPVKPLSEMAAPIFACWEELNPKFGSANAVLDISLLRQAIELVVQEGICHYRTFNKAVTFLRRDMGDLTHQELRTGRKTAISLFREADIGNVQGKAVTPILARSLLLLRLASASTASLFAAAGISKADLEFWWSPLGSDLGLWDDPADIESFSDLWTDVDDAKEEAHSRLSVLSSEPSVKTVATILAQNASLTQFSRAPMWLLGLD